MVVTAHLCWANRSWSLSWVHREEYSNGWRQYSSDSSRWDAERSLQWHDSQWLLAVQNTSTPFLGSLCYHGPIWWRVIKPEAVLFLHEPSNMLCAVQLTMRTNECDQNPAKSEHRDNERQEAALVRMNRSRNEEIRRTRTVKTTRRLVLSGPCLRSSRAIPTCEDSGSRERKHIRLSTRAA